MYLLLFVMTRAGDIERGVLTKWENCSPLFYLPGAAKLVEDVPDHVEDYDPHDLALDHNDAAAVVRGDAPRVLENVSSKLSDELTILGEDLDLVSGGPLCHHNVPSLGHHGHPVRVEQLPVPFSNLPKLELEVAILVEHLDAVVVGVRHDDLIVLSDGHAAWLSELALEDAELAKLTVVDHFLATNLSLGRVSYWGRWYRRGERCGHWDRVGERRHELREASGGRGQ